MYVLVLSAWIPLICSSLPQILLAFHQQPLRNRLEIHRLNQLPSHLSTAVFCMPTIGDVVRNLGQPLDLTEPENTFQSRIADVEVADSSDSSDDPVIAVVRVVHLQQVCCTVLVPLSRNCGLTFENSRSFGTASTPFKAMPSTDSNLLNRKHFASEQGYWNTIGTAGRFVRHIKRPYPHVRSPQGLIDILQY